VTNAEEISCPPLEFLDIPAVIGQPLPIQYVVDPRQQMRAVADFRTADVKGLAKGWNASENG